MGLSKLDLLSKAPDNFIFKNKSNKSILGGFLTLIFFIITLIIFAFYLINFITEQTYSIEYVFYEEAFLEDLEMAKRLENERYNQYFDFKFDLLNEYLNESLSDEYIILNDKDSEIIPRKTLLHKRVSDISFYVIYLCKDDDEECQIPDYFMIFQGIFNGYILDHQNETSPLYRMDINNDNMSLIEPFNTQYPMVINFSWKAIKYKKEAGISKLWNTLNGMSEEDQKIIGLTGDKSMSFYDYNKSEIIESDRVRMRIIAEIMFEMDFIHYDEYNRTKKSFLDLISKVFSLSLAVFNCLSLFLKKCYTRNFDNYKIVENILYDLKPPKKIKHKKIELVENSIESLLPNNDSENKISINKEEEENDSNEDHVKDKNDYGKNITNENYLSKRKLPKLRFLDFIFNNVYKCKCYKNNKQEMISKCNELIKKYYSIDSIIYYQLKLENLLKDYNWNNPELSNFDRNELIIQLNNLISIYENN